MNATCPRCGAQAPVGPDQMVRCECGLTGYVGYVNEYTYLNARLEWLGDRIAAGEGPPDPETALAYGVWQASEAQAPRPRQHSSSPQVILVSLGAALLILAALVFVAVAWDTIGPWGQIGSLAVLVVSLAAVAIGIRNRAHGAAEALAIVSFGLGMISANAAVVLGALPLAWDTPESPYRLLVTLVAMVLGIGLSRRFGLKAWAWLGWLLTPVALALALALITRYTDMADQVIFTLVGLTFLALGLAVLLPRHPIDLWPMRLAGAICLLVVIGATLGALVYDPPAASVLIVTAALLVTVLLRLEWVGWPLVGFWLALVAMFAPTATLTTAAVAAAGAVLLFVVARTSVLLAVISAGTLWGAYFVGSGGESPSVFAAIAGLALLGVSLREGAAPVAWFGAVTIWCALVFQALEIDDFRVPFFEVPTLALAALLLVAGLIARRSGTRNSGLVYGPALSVALLPTAVLCWQEVWEVPSLIRFVIVMVVGVPLLIIGVRRHMLGLVVPACVAVSIAGTAQIFATLDLLPRWLALGVAGGLLIAIGARLEWVRKRGKQTEEWLQTLR